MDRMAPPPRVNPAHQPVRGSGPSVLFAPQRERTHVDDARGAGFWKGALVASVGWILAWFFFAEARNAEVAAILQRGAEMKFAMDRMNAVPLDEVRP